MKWGKFWPDHPDDAGCPWCYHRNPMGNIYHGEVMTCGTCGNEFLSPSGILSKVEQEAMLHEML